ncbi:alpha-S1-casein [Mus pahari]|uniref:alpha-S1-casein n=1 Tax=Mus pahari TaxID=10093 RepID=UPI000A305C49|nr:alpha-S1-casein [Mus pahari]
MKLLILTCLVAAALAMPTQQQQSSSEEMVKPTKHLNLNEQRALLTEQNDEIKVTMDTASEESEEAIPNITEQKNIVNEDIINQCTLEQLQSQFKYNQLLQQASLFQQLLLAQQPSLALQASPAQQPSLVQQAFLAQQASLAQKHHPRLSQAYYYPHMEQPYRMSAYSQVQMRHPMSVVDKALAQFSVQPFPQFLQYDAYPVWVNFPQDMQYFTPEAVLNTFKPVVPKDTEKTNMW